ncbi:MAG: hypothetical protein KTR28_06560, partial [Micavibrio sp.]|nr:hypothetical protein [Micavibrio sp.]
ELAGRLLRKHMAKHGIPMEKIATFGHNADNLNKLFPDVAPKPVNSQKLLPLLPDDVGGKPATSKAFKNATDTATPLKGFPQTILLLKHLNPDFKLKNAAALGRVRAKVANGFKFAGKAVFGASKASIFLTFLGAAGGAAMANAEVNNNEKELDAILPTLFTDLPPEKAAAMRAQLKEDVNSIHNWYIAQSTADVTVVGGELKIRSDIDKIIDTYNLDPVTANLIMPDLLIDLGKGNRLEPKDHERLVNTYDPKALHTRAAQIAASIGIPAELPLTFNGTEEMFNIEYLLRDENITNQIKSQLRQQGQGKESIAAIDAIRKLNDMHAMSEYVLEEHEKARQPILSSTLRARQRRNDNLQTAFEGSKNRKEPVATEPKTQIGQDKVSAEFANVQKGTPTTEKQTAPESTPNPLHSAAPTMDNS